MPHCMSIAVTTGMSVRMHQRAGTGVDVVVAGSGQRYAGVPTEVCARGMFGVVLLQACGGVLQDRLELLRVLRLRRLLRRLVGGFVRLERVKGKLGLLQKLLGLMVKLLLRAVWMLLLLMLLERKVVLDASHGDVTYSRRQWTGQTGHQRLHSPVQVQIVVLVPPHARPPRVVQPRVHVHISM